MTTHKVRNIISFLVVGQWIAINFITILMVLFDLMSETNAIEFSKGYNSINSGIVGIIVGYYFGEKK